MFFLCFPESLLNPLLINLKVGPFHVPSFTFQDGRLSFMDYLSFYCLTGKTIEGQIKRTALSKPPLPTSSASCQASSSSNDDRNSEGFFLSPVHLFFALLILHPRSTYTFPGLYGPGRKWISGSVQIRYCALKTNLTKSLGRGLRSLSASPYGDA